MGTGQHLRCGSALILSGVRGDTRRYRTVHLWQQMNLLGLDGCIVNLTDSRVNEYLDSPWNMVILHRIAYDRFVQRIIRKARKNGALILFDVDDLIFEVSAFRYINSPDFADPLRTSLYKETMQRIRQTLEYSDAAIASTDFLAQYIRNMEKPVWVHRNAFSLEMYSCAQVFTGQSMPVNEQVVIGYASGTPTHNRDFELVKPAVREILSNFSRAKLHIIGPLDIGDDWDAFAGRVVHSPLVPWRELPGLLAKFDVNLAPLVTDNPFSQSKSEIKYMEAAMVGVPTVASPTDAFRYAIRDGANGFLAETTADWVSAIERLITDPDLREQIGKTAQTEVMDRYHPATRADDLQLMLAEVFAHFGRPPAAKVSGVEISDRVAALLNEPSLPMNRVEREPTRIQQGLYVLRYAGMTTLIKMILIFIRRFISPIFPYRK